MIQTTLLPVLSFFFFNDTATTEIYTLSLHDALPISCRNENAPACGSSADAVQKTRVATLRPLKRDRKSTRLNSSHQIISYAVFCLKKKKKIINYKLRCGATDDSPGTCHPLRGVRIRI